MKITGEIKQVFSQAKLLEKLKTLYSDETAVAQEAYECIKGGICYMLSVEWLLKLMEAPASYPDSIYDVNFDDARALMYYKQIASNYYKFASDYKFTYQKKAGHPGAETLPGSQMIDIDDKFVSLCSKSKYSVKNAYGIYDVPTDLTHVFTGDSALLLYLNITPSDPSVNGFAHEMAIWRYKNKNYFYDPNQGVFLLNDLSQIVGEIISGYTACVKSGATAELMITGIS